MIPRAHRVDFLPRPTPRCLASAWVLLLLRLGSAAPAAAPDARAVVDAWLAAQSHVTNWSADFVQTRFLKTLRQPLVSTGHVWYARPNSFRWELGRPAQTLAVRDGDTLQILYPRLERVERYSLDAARSGPLGEALGLLDAGFPRDHADFAARFRLLALVPESGHWRLDLEPLGPAARRMMPSIRLVLDATNYVLLANEIAFPDGSRIRNDFSGALRNSPFPSDTFRPAIDPRFRIVQPPTR